MTRKQWLETFIHLAVSGASALEYRKRLRLKTNVLRAHVKSLGSYQEELAAILAEELATAKALKLQRVKTKITSKDKARRDFSALSLKIKASSKKTTVKPQTTSTKITSEVQGLMPPAKKSPKPKGD